jgi:transforming growth factor-beta-induced protein
MKLLFSLCTLASLLGDVASQNVVDVAVGLPGTFSTLVTFVTAAGVGDLLATTEGITVFAPTNDAFAAVDATLASDLQMPMWILHLQDLLSYHVLLTEVPAGAVTDGLVATTLQGEDITLTTPSDGAVVVNGNAEVVLADVAADNGIIHAINNVLTPFWVSNSIVDIAVADSDFATLVSLVTLAELGATLSGPGPFTVFAPPNDAFDTFLESVGPEAATELTTNLALLGDVLKYHVVSGIVRADQITEGAELTTVQGEILTFSLIGGASVNGIPIVQTDILANNGIVHVIDGVLVPPSQSATESPVAAPTTAAPTVAPTSMSAAFETSFASMAALLSVLLVANVL